MTAEAAPRPKLQNFTIDRYSVEAFAATFTVDLRDRLSGRNPFYGVHNPVVEQILAREMARARDTLALLRVTFDDVCATLIEGRPVTISSHKDPDKCTVKTVSQDGRSSTYAVRREAVAAFADFVFDPTRDRVNGARLGKQFHEAFSSGQTIVLTR